MLQPADVFRSYERVGLAGLPAGTLAAVTGTWVLLLVAGVLLAIRRPTSRWPKTRDGRQKLETAARISGRG
jgi:hypothetical protein